MTEHFVKMDIEDPRAAAIAEVMANKTCKKILALLAERNELSASDIAQALGAPLNTVGYNMKKLVVSGLVEQTKKFFWSVKGKRIPTYRLSRKEIVISPRRLVSPQVISFFAVGIIAVIIAVMLFSSERDVVQTKDDTLATLNDSLKHFSSVEEFEAFVKANAANSRNNGRVAYAESNVGPVPAKSVSGAQADYSTTNVQVAGVDELDTVKNDGNYIYTVVGQNIVIVRAYPADTMSIVATIPINQSVQGIFVEGDRLVVLWSTYVPYQTF